MVMDRQTKETVLILKSWNDIPDNFTGVIIVRDNYEWYLDGEYHREDGPAIMFLNFPKEWWLHGSQYSQEEWFNALTPEQKEKAIWNMDNW